MFAQDSDFIAPDVEWFHLSPIIALVGGALFLLVAGALTPHWPRGWYAFIAAVTVGTAGGLAMAM